MATSVFDSVRQPVPFAVLAFVTAGLLVAGAPARASFQCTLYKWRTHDARYSTTYRYAADETRAASTTYKPMPKKGVYARVPLYEIASEPGSIAPCKNLAIRKRLFLQRKDDADYVFLEINEFYADDGTLIVTNIQNLTGQLRQTGYYVAADPLSIPEDAPPGQYQLVSKLLLLKKGRKASFLLASATARYEILPLK